MKKVSFADLFAMYSFLGGLGLHNSSSTTKTLISDKVREVEDEMYKMIFDGENPFAKAAVKYNGAIPESVNLDAVKAIIDQTVEVPKAVEDVVVQATSAPKEDGVQMKLSKHLEVVKQVLKDGKVHRADDVVDGSYAKIGSSVAQSTTEILVGGKTIILQTEDQIDSGVEKPVDEEKPVTFSVISPSKKG